MDYELWILFGAMPIIHRHQVVRYYIPACAQHSRCKATAVQLSRWDITLPPFVHFRLADASRQSIFNEQCAIFNEQWIFQCAVCMQFSMSNGMGNGEYINVECGYNKELSYIEQTYRYACNSSFNFRHSIR